MPLGKTPYSNDKLLPGLQRVTVRKDGYYEQVRMVEIKPNQQSALEFKLKPIPYARLTVKVRPPTTKVKIVDVEEPYAPGMKLAPGRYLVSLSHPMYGDKRLCAVLKDNEELTLDGDLAAWPGRIKIDSTPSDAVVYLDGREEGHTPFSSGLVWLPPGLHLVQVFKSLFKPVSRIVEVKSRETTVIKIDLPPAEHFTNGVGMEFVKIPAGKFMMGFNGSPEFVAARIIEGLGDLGSQGIAVYTLLFTAFPQHLVEITKPFYMQTAEVTNAQWTKVMGRDSKQTGLAAQLRTAYISKEPQLPVLYITMADVEEFLARLNQRDNNKYHYRLPTEAEWEYAARAGTKGFFYTGDRITTDQANFKGEPDFPSEKPHGIFRRQPIKVKSLLPNPWGLCDMYGNVRELCADWFDGFYYLYSPIKDPVRVSNRKGIFVKRGGSFLADWIRCISGNRGDAYGGSNQTGFRLVAEKLEERR